MGEASRRGTREDRIAQAIARAEADRICEIRQAECRARQRQAAREAALQRTIDAGKEAERALVSVRRSAGSARLAAVAMACAIGMLGTTMQPGKRPR